MVLQCSADVRGGIVDGAGNLNRGPAACSRGQNVLLKVIEEQNVRRLEARESLEGFVDFNFRFRQAHQMARVFVAEFGDCGKIGGSLRRAEVALPVGGVGVGEEAGGGFVVGVDVVDELRYAAEFRDQPGIVDGLEFLWRIEAIDGVGDFFEEVGRRNVAELVEFGEFLAAGL